MGRLSHISQVGSKGDLVPRWRKEAEQMWKAKTDTGAVGSVKRQRGPEPRDAGNLLNRQRNGPRPPQSSEALLISWFSPSRSTQALFMTSRNAR